MQGHRALIRNNGHMCCVSWGWRVPTLVPPPRAELELERGEDQGLNTRVFPALKVAFISSKSWFTSDNHHQNPRKHLGPWH